MKKTLFQLFGLLILTSIFSVVACTSTTPTTKTSAATEKVSEYDAISAFDCIDESKKSRKACPQLDKPVCGCDGQTYRNGCEADNNGVQSYTIGDCGKTKDLKPCFNVKSINQKMNCPMVDKPVCGCNGQTYTNGCVATRNGVLNFTPGPCKEANKKTATRNDCIDPKKIEANKDIPCPEMYAPVCGCDGVTYDSKCKAKKAGVIIYVKGVCKDKNSQNKSASTTEKCIDESKKNPDTMCPMIYKPVCGCDGKTYSNGCKATAEGVTNYTDGPCKE